ncbi:TonB-dependent receptor [Pseudoalteromonas luteoviolacea]|uniref:TonB-dependent receptor n=1 Tax=Pseudoalteromonas luteoviolacea TaxID=43657 RepID=A0A0C1QVD5_9GAMM|nr:TonB-dependent receptor plug domain-containing protein [Pseudoalteromonas luteoviolacea]KID59002.1 TonB-dependent receptor [Pseudoalteromonas luteoviolacea]
MKLKLSLLTMGLMVAFSSSADDAASTEKNSIETIEVTGDFQQESLQTLSASASVFGETEISTRGASYLDEILNSAANVNFTAGASRGRFVQIRGVGLRSQFVDPITPSVGVLIDNINYSGLGGSALLFDADQVAIYRGPQGTKFGADAMGGIIDIHSNSPTQTPSLNLKLGAANYGTHEAGVAVGAGLTDTIAARASIYQKQSDGFVDNVYLNDDTQDLDESIARFKLNYNASEDLTFGFVYHHIDIENGYDGFTLDNTRQSVASQPGQDTQQSDAFSFTADYTGLSSVDIEILTSGLQADTVYSYDEDWVCADTAQPTLCEAGLHPDHIAYYGQYFDAYARDHERGTLEVRVKGKDKSWVIGVVSRRHDVDLDRQRGKHGDLPAQFKSNFETQNHALFAHKVTELQNDVRLITGIRIESYSSDYMDSNAFDLDTDDTMVGGKVALEYQVVPQTMIYTSLNRGYKVGGVNGEALAKAKDDGITIPQSGFTFDPEYLWNFEFGVKGQSEDKRHTLNLSAFYMHREDMQLKQWQLEGVQFAGFISNAGKGRNYGLEIEGTSQLLDALSLQYSLGYLDTKIEDFITVNGDDFDGREQAQSPKYQYAFTFVYDVTDNISAQLGLEGKDDYFFSDSHDSQAPNQNLINASVSYYSDNWSLTAWGRNLADRDVPVRGFQFGNDPRNGWATDTYVQYGEPRVYGLTFNYTL